MWIELIIYEMTPSKGVSLFRNAVSKLIMAAGLSNHRSFAEVIISQDKLWSDLVVCFYQKERKRRNKSSQDKKPKLRWVRVTSEQDKMLLVEKIFYIRNCI